MFGLKKKLDELESNQKQTNDSVDVMCKMFGQSDSEFCQMQERIAEVMHKIELTGVNIDDHQLYQILRYVSGEVNQYELVEAN